ncbi:DUF2087 domain-containing protein [Brevibacterium antiquum]|uniref:DUF2087 domain-containing protein n=1 Tax=Brevibacterium antiquum TaxID=234835 RepID=UPI002278D512|nr:MULTISPECIES: DUF2087 domain-containing protein [Brevibacterium]
MPSKRKTLVVILVEILTAFEIGRIYGERDVNTSLSAAGATSKKRQSSKRFCTESPTAYP